MIAATVTTSVAIAAARGTRGVFKSASASTKSDAAVSCQGNHPARHSHGCAAMYAAREASSAAPPPGRPGKSKSAMVSIPSA